MANTVHKEEPMLPAAMLASGAASLFSNGLSRLGDQFLKKADKDKSNGVSLGEFANIMQAGQNMPSGTNTPAVSTTATDATKAKFGKIDTNTDGQLSTGEVNTYNQQLVSQIQASLVQLQQMYGAGQPQQGEHHPHKSLSEQFPALDANSDGTVGKDELTSFFAAKDAAKGKTSDSDASAKAQALFDKIDSNADGALSTTEVSAFDAARKAKKPASAGAEANLQDTFAQITKLLEAIQKQTSETSKKGSAASALAAATAYKAA
jgi:Ca2+-binding EF-hand superfamily protein